MTKSGKAALAKANQNLKTPSDLKTGSFLSGDSIITHKQQCLLEKLYHIEKTMGLGN